MTVFARLASDDVDRLGEARVAGRIGRLKMIQRAENVVVPARWEREARENGLDDLTGPVGEQKDGEPTEELAAALLRTRIARSRVFGGIRNVASPRAR